MATVYDRQRLNLTAPNGDKLVIKQLDAGAELSVEGSMVMTLPSLKLVSTGGTIDDVATKINLNAADIASEAVARTSADLSIETALNDESTARQAAVAAEENARLLADAAINASISTEIVSRQTADTNLQNSIDTEIATRLSADQSIDVVVSTNAVVASNSSMANLNLISATKSDLESVDLSLENSIANEKARIDGILNLSTADLDSFKEIVTAYENADTNLQTLITNLTTNFQELSNIVSTLVAN